LALIETDGDNCLFVNLGEAMVIPYLLTGLQLKTDRCAMTALEYGLIGPRSW